MWMMLNPPVAHLEIVTLFGLTHHLVLAHLIKESKKYKRFYKKLSKKGHWLTLDNSVMETGEPIFDLDLVNELKINEVVAPDYLFDADKTLAETRKFIEEIQNKDLKVKVMGVPQGENMSEYFKCLVSMFENPNIDSIGIGKTATSQLYSFENLPLYFRPLFGRMNVLTFICEELQFSKPVHILGIVNPQVEIPLYSNLPFIRSFDTSFPFRFFSSGKHDSTTDHQSEFDTSVLRSTLGWCEQILSYTGVEV